MLAFLRFHIYMLFIFKSRNQNWKNRLHCLDIFDDNCSLELKTFFTPGILLISYWISKLWCNKLWMLCLYVAWVLLLYKHCSKQFEIQCSIRKAIGSYNFINLILTFHESKYFKVLFLSKNQKNTFFVKWIHRIGNKKTTFNQSCELHLCI